LGISDELRCGDATHLGYGDSGPHSLEVDILCFSRGDGEHPWTRKSTVHVKDVSKADGVYWGMTTEIHTNLLAVLLAPELMTGRYGGWPDRELQIFDWTTGQEIAVSVVSTVGMNA
jgi:hypothetical protein